MLMKESFEERAAQGLNFSFMSFSIDEFIRCLSGNTIILALEDNKIVAFQQLILHEKYLECGLIAVSSNYKRCGIGTIIFNKSEQFAYKKNCEYMIADTATKAKSSVLWHLNNGYFKYKMRSFPSTNYYSIVFRKQLKPHWLWSNEFLCNIHFKISSVLCHLYRHEDGTLKTLGKLIDSVRNQS